MLQPEPLAYFISFSCYGHHLHGSQGSVDHRHHLSGAGFLLHNDALEDFERREMKGPVLILDSESRWIVLRAIKEVCAYRGWTLAVLHVRSTHLHSVVAARERPERVMNDFKSYASRALNAAGRTAVKRWTRHGSTGYLWTPEEVRAAILYAAEEQGEPMALYVAPETQP